jgi:hypothetical protein
MNTKDILKYAGILVGVYFLYRYAKDAGWLDKITGVTTTPDQKAIDAAAAAAKKQIDDQAAAAKLSADQVAALKAQVDKQAADLKALSEMKGGGTGAGAGLSEHALAIKNDPLGVSSVAAQAASGQKNVSWHGTFNYDPAAIARELGLRYSSDVWNYYRGYGGGDVPNVDLFPEGNRDYQMTIDEYLQARTAHSLSGLSAGWHQLAHMQSASPWIC